MVLLKMRRKSMAKCISIINEKGGVGRTTTSLNLAHCLSLQGYSVLIIDNDPQGNATFSMGKNRSNKRYLELVEEITPLVSIVVSGACVSHFEKEASALGLEGFSLLQEKIEAIERPYDFIIIDTAGTKDALLDNSLIASDYALIVSDTSFDSIQGVERLYGSIQSIIKHYNTKINVAGILFTKFRKDYAHHKRAYELLKDSVIGDKLFEATINQSTHVECAAAENKFLLDYRPTSKAGASYKQFTDEFLKRLKFKVPSLESRAL
jgi:chromosome partitioning protein